MWGSLTLSGLLERETSCCVARTARASDIANTSDLWWVDVPGDKPRPMLAPAIGRFVQRIAAVPSTRLDDVCEAYRFAAGC